MVSVETAEFNLMQAQGRVQWQRKVIASLIKSGFEPTMAGIQLDYDLGKLLEAMEALDDARREFECAALEAEIDLI